MMTASVRKIGVRWRAVLLVQAGVSVSCTCAASESAAVGAVRVRQAVAFADWAKVTRPSGRSVGSIPASLRVLQSRAAAKHTPPGGRVFGFGCARAELRSLRVLATIKDDPVVFAAGGSMRQAEAAHGR